MPQFFRKFFPVFLLSFLLFAQTGWAQSPPPLPPMPSSESDQKTEAPSEPAAESSKSTEPAVPAAPVAPAAETAQPLIDLGLPAKVESQSSADASGSPVQIHGDTVEYFQEGQKAVGMGHVTIDYEGARLEADKITVLMASKVATAEGHVVLTQKGSVFKGERGEYDFAKKIGRVDKMDASLDETYFGKAQTIAKVEENHYRITDTYVTTCCGDDPFYKISAHNIDYFPGDKVIMRNAVMSVRNVPVLFIPYYEQAFVDFNRFPVHLVPGKRDEWGAFLLSKWRYNLVNKPAIQSKGNVLLDYRQKRGFGGGIENFYRGDQIGHGALRAYYANDNQPPDEFNPNRDRYQWRHQSKLTASTTLTTEWNKLSDPKVVKDFFYHEEYERDVIPDNYVSIITATPNYTFSVLDRERLDDFYTVVERSPQLRFDTHNHQLFETPFYLRQEFQGDNLKKTGAKSDTSLDMARVDSNTTLSYAGRVGPVSVTPRVGTRQTYFSRDSDGDRALIRGIFEPGLDLSTHFFKTYEVYMHALGLDVNQLRHIFTPTFSYNYRPNPTVTHTLLQQFDALDAIDKDNFIRLNFENKLQTKEKGADGTMHSREFARVLPFLDVDQHTGRLENVGIDAELRPYSWMGIESDAAYNADTRDFETANFDVYFDHGGWHVAVGQRYVQNESSQTTADIRLKLTPDWEFRIYDRYEFEEGASKEFEATVSKAWDCVITDFTYNRREGDTFFVTLRLKAFPEAPFSLRQSYNHPKAEI